jgi:thiol-disulfide isomerase/thioredoxin
MKSIVMAAALFYFSSFNACAKDSEKTENKGKQTTARITVKLLGGKVSDTLTLGYWTKILHYHGSDPRNTGLPHEEIEMIPDSKGLYHFEINSISEITYFSLGKDHEPNHALVYILDLYLAEAGDDIHIEIQPDSKNDSVRLSLKKYYLKFIGKGSDKYTCRNAIDRTFSPIQNGRIIDSNYMLIKNSYLDSRRTLQLKVLESYRKKVSAFIYNILKADIIGQGQYLKYYSLIRAWNFLTAEGDASHINNFVNSAIKSLSSGLEAIPDRAIVSSRYYPYFLLLQGEVIQQWKKKLPSSHFYQLLKEYKNAELRDKLITIYLFNKLTVLTQKDSLVADALACVQTNYCLIGLRERTNLFKGSPAFDFCLPDSEGKQIKLSDFKGKVLFIDFWFTGCAACRVYHQEVLSKAEDNLANNPEIVFMTISIDLKDTWQKTIKTGNYTSDKAVNLYTAGLGWRHPMITHYNITGYPRPLVIGKNGKIYNTNSKELRNLAGLTKVLTEALNEAEVFNAR